MIIGVQLLGVAFGMLMVYLTFVHFKKREYTVKEFSVWMILWLAFILIALFPQIMQYFVHKTLGMSRTLDFLIIIGFIMITGIMFYTYSVVRKTQNKIEEIVRKFALKNHKKK